MFLNIFINRLKCIIRDKQLVFWTLLFPIILGTFFNLAFSNISAAETFKAFNVAVVDSEEYQKDTYFQGFIGQHMKDDPSAENDIKLFNVKVVTQEEADRMLNDSEIVGYITYGSPLKLTVKNSGYEETILKEILDQYSQTASAVETIIKKDPSALQKGLAQEAGNISEYTRELKLGTKDKPDNTVNYFYTLIAMASFYFAFFGLKEVTDIQANLSKRAARLNVAPVHKIKVLISGLSASLVIALIEMVILISYMVFVLKIDFGNQLGLVLLTCFVGCAAGVSFGALISSVIKKGEGVKVAILIASTMTASFFAGMMFDKMKYIVQENLPILSYLNPVALVTDALYALYYYDTYTRFYVNIGLLGAFTVLFCLITYMVIRRQRYDNI